MNKMGSSDVKVCSDGAAHSRRRDHFNVIVSGFVFLLGIVGLIVFLTTVVFKKADGAESLFSDVESVQEVKMGYGSNVYATVSVPSNYYVYGNTYSAIDYSDADEEYFDDEDTFADYSSITNGEALVKDAEFLKTDYALAYLYVGESSKGNVLIAEIYMGETIENEKAYCSEGEGTFVSGDFGDYCIQNGGTISAYKAFDGGLVDVSFSKSEDNKMSSEEIAKNLHALIKIQ